MQRAVLALTAIACASNAARAEPRHDVYVELLGKGGLWGLGYDYQLARRYAVGVTTSYYVLSGEHYTTLAPYATAYPLLGEHHRGFVQLGPQLVRHSTPSLVPEWDGMTTTAFSGELSAGYEYRRGVLVRLYGMFSVGAHATPWLGLSVGWTL